MRVKVEYRSSSKECYKDFCKKNPGIKVSFTDWKEIIYLFNEEFRKHILETGDKLKLPFGFGEFSIIKKKRQKVINIEGKEFINLPIDWKRTKEKGKKIYIFNHHTEGYFFGWNWFKKTAMFKHSDFWYFKPFRTTSRLITEYINKNEGHQHIYKEWVK